MPPWLISQAVTGPSQYYSHQWPETLQRALSASREIPDDELDTISSLDMQTADVFAEACIQLLENSSYQARDIKAISNHGQTIRHRPDIENRFSLQIGNAQELARLTGIDVISDFRTADIEAGGQGAPLAPAFHQAVFRHEDINRIIVNIGGISNITILPADINQAVSGFDCGPGNTLMDAWICRQQQVAYDADGALAAAGKTDVGLLARLLMDEYFQLASPKSAGFDNFNLDWLDEHVDSETSVADMQSTLCDLTATSIIPAINQYAPDTDEIYICGGGAHNTVLMNRIQALSRCPVETTETLGVHPDWVEAMAFAWLAYQNEHQRAGNLPSVTGADRSVVLGKKTFTVQTAA